MKKVVLREYLKNRENKQVIKEEPKEVKVVKAKKPKKGE